MGFYPASLLDNVRYRVGQGHELSVQANSIRFGDAVAVALIDTIVFADQWDAQNNVVLWAHELRHIDQYRRWGLTDFGKRYVRSYRRVEEEAENAEREFNSWRNSSQNSSIGGKLRRIFGSCISLRDELGSMPNGHGYSDRESVLLSIFPRTSLGRGPITRRHIHWD